MPAVSIFYFTLSIFQLWSRIGEIYLLLTLIRNYCRFSLRGNLKPTFNLMIFSHVRFKINLWRFFITAVFGGWIDSFCSLIDLLSTEIEPTRRDATLEEVIGEWTMTGCPIHCYKIAREYLLDALKEIWLGQIIVYVLWPLPKWLWYENLK